MDANILTNECIMELNHIKADDLIRLSFESAFAWKCTLKHLEEQGTAEERSNVLHYSILRFPRQVRVAPCSIFELDISRNVYTNRCFQIK